jgi:mannitol-1-/sugar-/sorbitol-6-phosphatase
VTGARDAVNLPAGILLFDSDGVLVDSDASVIEAWSQWADHYDLPTADVLEMVHGRPARQTVAFWLPGPLQPDALDLIVRLELATASSVRAMPGSVETVSSLAPGRWAVITSGTSELAAARLAAAGIPRPPVLITADDVTHGKPAPDPYLAAARALDVPAGEGVVFEDAPAGIASARAAGVGAVVGVGRRTRELGVDAYVPDLSHLTITERHVVI